MPKLLSPDHNQGGVLDNDSSPIDNTTTLLSDPAVNQTENVVTDHVDVMSQITSIYGINWTHDLSVSPTSTGLVEGRVKLCKTLLSFLTLKNPDLDPYESLLDLQFCMNNSSSSVTGLTPHLSFHGFETVDSLDLSLKCDAYLPSNDVLFAESLQGQAQRRKEMVKICKDFAARDMKFKQDSTIIALPDFSPGDLVLLQMHNHPRSSKQMRKFKVLRKGPYRIHSIDNYHCTLVDMDNNLLPDLYPVRKLQKIEGFTSSFPIDRETANFVESVHSDESYNSHNGAVVLSDSDIGACSLDIQTHSGSAHHDNSDLCTDSDTKDYIDNQTKPDPQDNVTTMTSRVVDNHDCGMTTADNTHAERDLSQSKRLSTNMVIGNKIRCRNNELQVLCYPLGVKKSGTYLPLNALNL